MSILIRRETSAGSEGARRATVDPAGRDAAGFLVGRVARSDVAMGPVVVHELPRHEGRRSRHPAEARRMARSRDGRM